MSKRETVESKIISYFSEESDEKVNLLFGIIKGIVAKRAPKKSKEPRAAGKKGPKEAFTLSVPERPAADKVAV